MRTYAVTLGDADYKTTAINAVDAILKAIDLFRLEYNLPVSATINFPRIIATPMILE